MEKFYPIIIENLTLKVNKRHLIEQFNFEIKEAGLYFLTGENGSGKSTFLKTICKLYDHYDGNVLINNKNIKSWTNFDLASVLAFVNTYRAYNDYFSTRELVSLGNIMNADNSLEEYTDKAMQMMSISHLANQSVHELSDGEFQKANIARALSQNTPILLLDEPSAFLDYPSKKNLFQMLSNLVKNENKIILCSTHDIELAKGFSSKFLHFENKTIQLLNHAPDWG